jgi:hypothetical protein
MTKETGYELNEHIEKYSKDKEIDSTSSKTAQDINEVLRQCRDNNDVVTKNDIDIWTKNFFKAVLAGLVRRKISYSPESLQSFLNQEYPNVFKFSSIQDSLDDNIEQNSKNEIQPLLAGIIAKLKQIASANGKPILNQVNPYLKHDTVFGILGFQVNPIEGCGVSYTRFGKDYDSTRYTQAESLCNYLNAIRGTINLPEIPVNNLELTFKPKIELEQKRFAAASVGYPLVAPR